MIDPPLLDYSFCRTCRAQGPFIEQFRSDDRSSSAWNRRAPDLRAFEELVELVTHYPRDDQHTVDFSRKVDAIRRKYQSGKDS